MEPSRRGAAHGCRVVAATPSPTPSPHPPARYARARLARGFSEIERKSFELDREGDVLEANVARNFDTGGCEVQNGLDPRRGQLGGRRLRRLRGTCADLRLNRSASSCEDTVFTPSSSSCSRHRV